MSSLGLGFGGPGAESFDEVSFEVAWVSVCLCPLLLLCLTAIGFGRGKT